MSNQSNHNIHLDSCIVVKDLWKENIIVFLTKNKQPLSYVKFIKLWQSCFPHVTIRKYKTVTGKCLVCCKLSELRQNCAASKECFQLQCIQQFMIDDPFIS